MNVKALKTLGVGNDGANAALNGFVKSGLLAGLNADVDKFKNHESSARSLSKLG
ncbi:MAG: hypothetical protein I8H91_10920 [Burkholderiales bacterium]|nr:hypothetical protein [Burkholderiales bacterium]